MKRDWHDFLTFICSLLRTILNTIFWIFHPDLFLFSLIVISLSPALKLFVFIFYGLYRIVICEFTISLDYKLKLMLPTQWSIPYLVIFVKKNFPLRGWGTRSVCFESVESKFQHLIVGFIVAEDRKKTKQRFESLELYFNIHRWA